MREFLAQLDDQRIVQAIQQAESATSAEIRVFITRKSLTDPVAAAEEEFARLKMHRTRDRNGVLILIAPASRNFAVFGDRGIHERCGENFWREMADELAGHFKREAATDGIVHAVTRAGKLLAEHFPRRPDDKNELPDHVARD
jgi:uncharacterized membrane protein